MQYLVKNSKFITAQWDTTDPGRSIPEAEINIIENRYKEQGYEIVRVGGEASIPDMNDSIQAIGYAMAKADGHIGIDSGFLHMANLYHKAEDIHLYTTGGYISQSFVRAKARGVKIYNKVDVSVGELFDKLSILEIKASKGLDVDTEKQKLLDVYQEYNNTLTRYLYIHLKEVNSSLWLIEDKKKFRKRTKFS